MIAFDALDGLPLIRVVGDVIPIEDSPGFVSRDFHRHFFADASANEISNACSPQVVKQPMNAHFVTRRFPTLSKLADRRAVVAMKYEPHQDSIHETLGRATF